MVSCAAAQPLPNQTEAPSRLTFDEVRTLPDRLGCGRHQSLLGDISFYDEMAGVDCYFQDGTSLLVRAYAHDASPRQVLVGLDGTFGSDNQYVLGANWYAAGSPDRSRALASQLDADLTPSISVDTTVPPLDPIDESTGTCMSVVASLIRAQVEGRAPQGDYSSLFRHTAVFGELWTGMFEERKEE